MNLPRISIVTPCFNSATHLEAAITSVLMQGYPDLEYVVVDGASTDGSVEIIERYADRLTSWVSEPDEGQYQALNKGFAKTTGEIMGYLNADDLFLPGALHVVGEVFRTFPDMEWLTGAHTALRSEGLPLERFRPIRWSRGHLLSERAGRFLPQESTFWRRSLWDRAGGRMDERYRLAGDFELWARFSREAVPAVIDAPLGCFRFVEGQRSVLQRDEYLREVREIRHRERARSPADERAARAARTALTTRSRLLRRREAGFDLSPVVKFRPDLDRYTRDDVDESQDLRRLGAKVGHVLAGRERLDLTPRKLAKHGRDLLRLASEAAVPATEHLRGLAGRARISEVTSSGSGRHGDDGRWTDILRTAVGDYGVAVRRAYREAALHGDRVFQALIREVIGEVPIGSFVETGTYLGATTGWVAARHPTLPVFTCDIDPGLLERARRRLWTLGNVRLAQASSDQFVQRLLADGHLRGIPLFFLDAHWYREWPLPRELAAISESRTPSVIVIDDFRVPDRPEFGFDTWEADGGTHACDLELVVGHLGPGNDYRFLVPDYVAGDAFRPHETPLLRGHLAVFQNLSESLDRLMSTGEIVPSYYRCVRHP